MHFLLPSWYMHRTSKKHGTFIFTIALTFAGIFMPPMPTVGSEKHCVFRSYVGLATNGICCWSNNTYFCTMHYFCTKYLMGGFQ